MSLARLHSHCIRVTMLISNQLEAIWCHLGYSVDAHHVPLLADEHLEFLEIDLGPILCTVSSPVSWSGSYIRKQ